MPLAGIGMRLWRGRSRHVLGLMRVSDLRAKGPAPYQRGAAPEVQACDGMRAKGPAPYQPGAAPQVKTRQQNRGLKARSMCRDGSGRWPLRNGGGVFLGRCPDLSTHRSIYLIVGIIIFYICGFRHGPDFLTIRSGVTRWGCDRLIRARQGQRSAKTVCPLPMPSLAVDRLPGQSEVADTSHPYPDSLRAGRAIAFPAKVTTEFTNDPDEFTERRLAFFRRALHHRTG